MTILPTLTTTSPDWEEKIAEIKKLKLKKIAYFPTAATPEERHKILYLLQKTSVTEIPFIHLRNDMELQEINFFINHYKTQVFNTHPANSSYPPSNHFKKFNKIIYIENLNKPFKKEYLNNWAGGCIDLSHLENTRLTNQAIYQSVIKTFKNTIIGCAHISAINKKPKAEKWNKNKFGYDNHFFNNLKQFDYLKKYKKYTPPIIALELINPISEQLQAKKYIKKILA